jgi:hypothetical protein
LNIERNMTEIHRISNLISTPNIQGHRLPPHLHLMYNMCWGIFKTTTIPIRTSLMCMPPNTLFMHSAYLTKIQAHGTSDNMVHIGRLSFPLGPVIKPSTTFDPSSLSTMSVLNTHCKKEHQPNIYHLSLYLELCASSEMQIVIGWEVALVPLLLKPPQEYSNQSYIIFCCTTYTLSLMPRNKI